MAEARWMTAAREAVVELMRSEHADVLRESVAFMLRELHASANVTIALAAAAELRVPLDDALASSCSCATTSVASILGWCARTRASAWRSPRSGRARRSWRLRR